MSDLALIRQPVKQTLPPGVMPGTGEIFTTGDENYAILGGNTTEFDKWPEWLYAQLYQELRGDIRALRGLARLGIDEELQMIWQFSRCRKGACDTLPDVVDGELVNTEFFDCGIRGNCVAEGDLCRDLKMPGGEVITPREMDVWRLITRGKLDKEIANDLNLSPTTIPQYVRILCRKCECRNRTELVRLGMLRKLS